MKTKSLLAAGFLGLMACPLAGQDAAGLYRQLCDDGDMVGCSLLGVMYRDGTGVTQDLARAASLFEQACNRSLVEGCARLGVMYANGLGVPQDVARGVSLSRQACDGGDQQGCSNFEVLAGLMRVALLQQLPVEDRTLAIGGAGSGTLSDADPVGPDGSPVQAWALELRAGQQVTADLTSSDFDAFLLVTGPGLTSELSDDDGGSGCDARVTFIAPEDGEYRAIVGTAEPGNTGFFVLRASDAPPAIASRPCSRALDPFAVARPGLLAGGTDRTAVETEGSSTLIVRAELEEYFGRNALEAIQQLNSRWLRATRVGGGFSGPAYARVVLDGTHLGPLEELSRISTESVEYIRFLSAIDATTKYGTGFAGGAIEVTSRGR